MPLRVRPAVEAVFSSSHDHLNDATQVSRQEHLDGSSTHKGYWYLIEHDRLVLNVRKATTWIESRAWKESHGYSSGSITRVFLESLAENKLDEVYGGVVLKAEG